MTEAGGLIPGVSTIQEMGIIFWLNFDHVNFCFGTFIFHLNAYQNV